MDTLLGLDYQTWWFLVVGGVFSGYAILDGFDFGAGAWHLFFRKEQSRRVAMNAVGPVWDGNEVWLVIGGGALFAGFPIAYASLLSAMYTPFMLFLFFIIFRAVSIEFRGKEEMKWWRKTWDIVYSFSSIMLGFLLGVVLGNVLIGIPIDANHNYNGDALLSFLNPYSILMGLTSLSLFMSHGAIYLLLKTEGKLYERLVVLQKYAMGAFIIVFGITSLYTLAYQPHLSDKLMEMPASLILPLLVVLSIANIPRLTHKKKFLQAFLFSSLCISFMLVLCALEAYPNLLISSISPENNIDIYNGASSLKSLKIMMIIVAIGGPLVLGYTFFVYKTFKGKVKIDETSY